MPTDIALGRDKDIRIDDANDIGLVSGQAQLEQSVAIDVFDELTDFIGGKVTGRNLGLLEERIRQGLNDDPQLDEVTNVRIVEYDRGNDSIVIEASVPENDDFTLSVEA